MQRKRRQFLVEKRVQGALGVRIALHWLVFLSLSVTVTCVLRMPGKLEYPTLWAGLQAALLEQLASITVLLALLPWFIHDSLKLSNRFAGPMLRLKKAIVQLTNEQEAPPVIFRSGDFWLELADDFNELRGRVLAE
ncbi:MAG: hypothetical protein KDA45_15860, partial [Planctomycetales bacterium]|nr:hypothetical protein [Planctomycetales bacterium]